MPPPPSIVPPDTLAGLGLNLFRAGGWENMPPLSFFALTSVKMIESTWDLFLKSFLVIADNISKGYGPERAS